MIFKLLGLICFILNISIANGSDKIELYFNHQENNQYQDSYRGIKRKGDNFEAVVVNAINMAKSQIDLAIHDLNLPLIAKALVKKQKAGVKVRVIFENQNSSAFRVLTAEEITALSSRDLAHYLERFNFIDADKNNKISFNELNNRDAITILENAQIPMIDDTADGSTGAGIMHHKFMVVDQNFVLQTSANFTLSDFHGDLLKPYSRGNQNALMIVHDKAIALAFTQEFNELWSTKFGVKKSFRGAQTFEVDGVKIKLQFSPSPYKTEYEKTTNGLIQKALGQAKESVNLALFVFSEQQLATTLNEKNKEGVRVSALVEPNFAYRYYSELLDLFGVKMRGENCQYEKNNLPWSNPSMTSGVPKLPDGDLLHHKFAVVDGEITIFGSHNWSSSANQNNDEALLVIEDNSIAEGFNKEHKRLMKKAFLGAPDWLHSRIAEVDELCGYGK